MKILKNRSRVKSLYSTIPSQCLFFVQFIQRIAKSGLTDRKGRQNTFIGKSKLPCQKTKYYVGKKYPNVYFTYQEARCVLYFLKGFTYKKTAQIMHLSKRTVDYYAANICMKMLCGNKKEFLKKIVDTDFVNYLTMLEQLETSLWQILQIDGDSGQ